MGVIAARYQRGRPTKAMDPKARMFWMPAANAWRCTQLLGGDGMHVPADRISPFATPMLSLMPLPNHDPVAGTSNQNNYQFPQNTRSASNDCSLRLDQYFTQHSLIVRRFTRVSR